MLINVMFRYETHTVTRPDTIMLAFRARLQLDKGQTDMLSMLTAVHCSTVKDLEGSGRDVMPILSRHFLQENGGN
jgi:hypothetical protein